MQITLSLPVSKLETLGQTRRQGAPTTTINGYAVRSAYLNHCQGVWRGICSSNLSTSREWVTGQVSAEVVNEECSGAVKNPPRCASGVVPCGGGLRVAAVAFRIDPCSEETINSIIIAVTVGVVVATLALLVCFYCAFTRFGLQQGKDTSDNSDSDSYTDTDSRIDHYEGLFRADSPSITMENDPGSVYFDNYRYSTHHSSPRLARRWLAIASMHTVVCGMRAGRWYRAAPSPSSTSDRRVWQPEARSVTYRPQGRRIKSDEGPPGTVRFCLVTWHNTESARVFANDGNEWIWYGCAWTDGWSRRQGPRRHVAGNI